MTETNKPYGTDDASYIAAGGEAGIRKLVHDFYLVMDTDPDAARIRNMHPKDIFTSEEKLWRFLSGWMNGPKRYQEKYGHGVAIPMVHQPFPIEQNDGKAWLSCMRQALDMQPYDEDFKDYLMEQFQFPVNRILQVQAMKQEQS